MRIIIVSEPKGVLTFLHIAVLRGLRHPFVMTDMGSVWGKTENFFSEIPCCWRSNKQCFFN